MVNLDGSDSNLQQASPDGLPRHGAIGDISIVPLAEASLQTGLVAGLRGELMRLPLSIALPCLLFENVVSWRTR